MKEDHRDPDSPITRRQILGIAIAGVVTSAAWPKGLKQAVTQSRSTGKPLLTDVTLSEMFTKNRGLLTEFETDPKAFMLNRFALTTAQENAVRATTPEELAAIRKGVETALRENLQVAVTCQQPALRPQQKLVAQAQRFQYVEESSGRAPGRAAGATLYMNVTGFRR